MPETDTMGGFGPFNDAHAIISASLHLQFSNPVPEQAWQELRSAIIGTGKLMELGSPQPYWQATVSFETTRIGVSVNAPTAGVSDISGMSFTRIDEDDAIIDRFVVTRDAIDITTHSYIRWAPFWTRASKFISHIFPAFAANAQVAAIKTDYWDRFDFRGAGTPNLSGLVRSDCPFVARDSLEQTDASHSQTGRFVRLDNRIRRLVNVRFDHADFPTKGGVPTRAVILHTMMQDALNAQGYEPTAPTEFGLPETLACFERQHVELKELLRGIITAEAGARIGL